MRMHFIDDLRQALNHLYDPDYLSRSPLHASLGISGQSDRPMRLQCLLEEGIAAMRPRSAQSTTSRDWRAYQLLSYRYLQQFSQKEVADQLGVSLSQLAREQRAALSALAAHLWQGCRSSALHEPQSAADTPDMASGSQEVSCQEDLAWMGMPSPDHIANLRQTLGEVADLIQPLLVRYQVYLEIPPTGALPVLAANRVALRQILLSLLNAQVHFAAGGHVAISVSRLSAEMAIRIVGFRPHPPPVSTADDWEASLAAARQLAEVCGGKLSTEIANAVLKTELTLSVLESLPILVVDDSADAIHLLERFTVSTRYRLFGIDRPEKAMETAEEIGARAIVLDIMMPRADGWSILQSLRSNPATTHLPIVICSILPLKELSLSLGTDAFLQKPVSQKDFLTTLDRLIPLATESC